MNKWDRHEEADFIIEFCGEALSLIPIQALKTGVIWMPSEFALNQILECKERVERYAKRYKINGWKEDESDTSTIKKPGKAQAKAAKKARKLEAGTDES